MSHYAERETGKEREVRKPCLHGKWWRFGVLLVKGETSIHGNTQPVLERMKEEAHSGEGREDCRKEMMSWLAHSF